MNDGVVRSRSARFEIELGPQGVLGIKPSRSMDSMVWKGRGSAMPLSDPMGMTMAEATGRAGIGWLAHILDFISGF